MLGEDRCCLKVGIGECEGEEAASMGISSGSEEEVEVGSTGSR